MTIDEAKKIIGYMKAYWPRMELAGSYQVAAYAETFADDDVAQIAGAIKRLARRLQWPPSVAEIYAEVELMKHGAEKFETVAEAKATILAAITSGRLDLSKVSERARNAMLLALQGEEYGRISFSDLTFVWKRFEEHYAELANVEKQREYTPRYKELTAAEHNLLEHKQVGAVLENSILKPYPEKDIEKNKAIIESQREKLRVLYREPKAKVTDTPDGGDLVAGNDDQRFVSREEKELINKHAFGEDDAA